MTWLDILTAYLATGCLVALASLRGVKMFYPITAHLAVILLWPLGLIPIRRKNGPR